ncbi:MAG: hypothetical protein A2169_15245 [Deltaproteobacteria bacterium RBG_13_47_9]|nr:MAG: hypothetical protein A2169_15245 [Deltaproteobacteria bacterium RBG_13_47_9]
MGNDVGEIRRVLNSFLQLIEQDDSDSLLLAATNHPDILDHALFRRFDDVIEFGLPREELILSTLKAKLGIDKRLEVDWERLVKAAEGLSYADITRACEDAMKDVIIHDRNEIKTTDVLKALSERQMAQGK